ncbi:MAG: DUF6471 domain-containing protein [Arcobacteraceae bacterium]
MERDFNKESKLFVKRILLERDLSFIDLTNMLNEAGYTYSLASVRQKINRGRYDFAFLLQICEVLNLKITVNNN